MHIAGGVADDGGSRVKWPTDEDKGRSVRRRAGAHGRDAMQRRDAVGWVRGGGGVERRGDDGREGVERVCSLFDTGCRLDAARACTVTHRSKSERGCGGSSTTVPRPLYPSPSHYPYHAFSQEYLRADVFASRADAIVSSAGTRQGYEERERRGGRKTRNTMLYNVTCHHHHALHLPC